jgi:predicted dehydrogenase
MAVVGCGNIAKSHLAAIVRNYANASVAHIAITCVCDPNESQRLSFAQLVAEQTGIMPKQFGTLADALKDAASSFDSVNICVPNDLHEAIAVEAFAAKKHVILEKPIALDPDSAQRILSAARASKTVFMVAENAQYWKEILVVKKCIDDGRFGHIVSVRARCLETIVNQNEWQGDYAPGLWRSDPQRAGGGYVFDSASHW